GRDRQDPRRERQGAVLGEGSEALARGPAHAGPERSSGAADLTSRNRPRRRDDVRDDPLGRLPQGALRPRHARGLRLRRVRLPRHPVRPPLPAAPPLPERASTGMIGARWRNTSTKSSRTSLPPLSDSRRATACLRHAGTTSVDSCGAASMSCGLNSWRAIVRPRSGVTTCTGSIELLFEEERKKLRAVPARFRSIHVFRTIGAARRFRDEWRPDATAPPSRRRGGRALLGSRRADSPSVLDLPGVIDGVPREAPREAARLPAHAAARALRRDLPARGG